MPKFHPARPDFMAPGPHVILEEKEDIRFDDPLRGENDEDEDGSQVYRYYKSTKILGRLYRNINEREVFREIQRKGTQSDRNPSSVSVLDSLWAIVMERCKSLHWKRHRDMARNIRD
jgi:hypothetical protein